MERLYLGHYSCGCSIFKVKHNVIIDYCPKHKAAPDMYEALKGLLKLGDTPDLSDPRKTLREIHGGRFEDADQALSKARGE